jgi:hypothetical protein
MSDGTRRWLIAGTMTAIIDGAFSSILSAFFYGSTVSRLFQGVAAVPFGKIALDDSRYALVGIAMHLGVAFFWAGVFVIALSHSAALQRIVSTLSGLLLTAALYGPFVWLVMSCGVIPLLAHRAPTFNTRWLIQLAGHAVFVGLPIVWFGSRGVVRSPEQEGRPRPAIAR